MRNILIVCPKPFLCKIVEQHMKENYPNQLFAYDNYPFIAEQNCKLLALEKREDGYYKEGKRTDEFSDYVPQYAIAKSEFVKNRYSSNIDAVLFVGSRFPQEILACTEYCFANNIPKDIAFHSCQILFSGDELHKIMDLDNICPLFEIVNTMEF